MNMTPPTARHRSRGLALVSVLWVVALLTVVAAGLSASVRSESRVVGNMRFLIQAQYAVEGGVELAAMNLMYPQSVRWPADGTIRDLNIGDARVRIATVEETSMIDINHAPAELLHKLLSLAGVDSDQADLLVDAILDWRDGDDFQRLNGAEDSDYRIAGLPYGTKDAPFDSVDELRLVLGMTREIYAGIEPSLTVFSGQSGVNLTHASPQVTAAAAGLDDLQFNSGGTTYTIKVEARVADSIVSQAEATINITYNGIGRPYRILQWRQPESRLFPDPPPDDNQVLTQ